MEKGHSGSSSGEMITSPRFLTLNSVFENFLKAQSSLMICMEAKLDLN